MVLKAISDTGSLGSDLRVIFSVEKGRVPSTSGISGGAGRKSMTASSTKRTPLCLRAEPASTGVATMDRVAARMARMAISSETSLSSSRSSMSSSSESATASSISARAIVAASWCSAGIGPSMYSRPLESSTNSM